MTYAKLKTDLETLKNDAENVFSDISSLSATVKAAADGKLHGISDDITLKVATEFKTIRGKLQEIEKRTKAYAGMAHQHIKQNPYLYMLSCLGVGVLLGKLLAPKNR